MHFISILALILLTMAGYANGVVLGLPRRIALPKLLDVLITFLLIAAALFSRTVWVSWWAYLAAYAAALVIGVVVAIPRAASFQVAPDAPSTSPTMWQRWMGFSLKIGNFQSRLILSVLFFTLLLPFSLGSTFIINPLKPKPAEKFTWEEWKSTSDTLLKARRQF